MNLKFNIPSLLRPYSKILCAATLCLIFLGGLVKSTESGLSVPDWPTTYGQFMFAFPLDQMVGGIKYEHTHRMVASIVGLMTLVLCVGLYRSNVSRWIQKLGLCAFIAVVVQGVLGGLTVKFFLPVWLSSFHGTLAHIFFLITLMIAYALSKEFKARQLDLEKQYDGKFVRMTVIFTGMILVQLVLGNLMRHTESGLAVPDFPTMGGQIIPSLDHAMLERINGWRFGHNLDSVTMGQVHIHLWHRFWAVLIVLKLFYLNFLVYARHLNDGLIVKTLFFLNIAVGMQIMLGIAILLSLKEVYTTTSHVMTGAVVLALGFMLVLRASPVSYEKFQGALKQ